VQSVTRVGTFANVDDTSNAGDPCVGKDLSGSTCRSGDSLYDFNGSIDDIKIYKYARTLKQIQEDLNGSHPSGGSPVASQIMHLKFDEQQGQTLNNSNPIISLTANRGTTSASQSTDPTWKLEESCKLNGCLDFDGSDDVATVTNASAIDLNEGLLFGFTMSAWIYPDGAGEGSGGQVFYKGANTWLRVDTLSSGKLDIEGSLDLATSDATLNVSGVVTQSAWNHVAMTWSDDGDDEITIWVNGKAVGTSTNGSGAAAADTTDLSIGGITTDNFDGKIDEVKIYSSELSSNEILIDANAGFAAALGGVLGNHNNEGIGTTAPVGWWKLDEKTGTTTNDSSGNGGVSSTFTGNTAWDNGKFGAALNFDGTDDVARIVETTPVDIGATTDSYTVGAWIKTTANYSGNATAIAKDDGSGAYPYSLYLNSSEYACFQISDGTNSPSTCGSTALNDGAWHYISGVRSVSADTIYIYVDGAQINSTSDTTTATAVNNDDISIGNSGTSYTNNDFNGLVDEVKVYNYVRSNSQVAYDYNRGAPLLWYKLDECTGTTIYNSALNAGGQAAGFNGTLTVGGSGSQTSAGTCSSGVSTEAWNNGTTGKFNYSLNFDNTDDGIAITHAAGINLGATTDSYSISAWVKTTSSQTDDVVIKWNESGAYPFALRINDIVSNKALFALYDGSNVPYVNSLTTVNDGSWHHLVGIRNVATDTIYIYVDGKLEAQATDTTSGSIANSTNLTIGINANNTYNFNGQIDDVRIYNYALDPSQVKVIFNGGAADRFGPATGSP
jgi:hypothetical protein